MQLAVYELFVQFNILLQMLATFLQMKWILAVLEVISSVMLITAIIILHRRQVVYNPPQLSNYKHSPQFTMGMKLLHHHNDKQMHHETYCKYVKFLSEKTYSNARYRVWVYDAHGIKYIDKYFFSLLWKIMQTWIQLVHTNWRFSNEFNLQCKEIWKCNILDSLPVFALYWILSVKT